ncbi:SapC family protein [Vreelandella gomseomensis]|uniref:SapC family protein n=1 Tax=Vreelandella gomseomensis TaxID=370766 RepID=A0ABU1GG31_9GAMM|nr:SapC family protein [Halomonas gomseomensis]MDR5876014.1 SapC family protein [Halomonas gomseomensis]
MTQWIALSKTGHADTLYWPRDGYHFASDQQVVPVLLAELGKLLPHYALGFVKEGERYQPVAITGLGQGNLYLHPEGKWLGNYVPAALRGYPFRLAQQEDQTVLCVAQDHLTDDDAAKPLFDNDGNLAKTVSDTLEFLKQCEQSRQVTNACVQKLADAGVIEEWPLQIGRGDDQQPLKVNGLHRISEQALNALDAETLHGLRGGPLSLAYAQMLSTHQVSELTKRAELLAKVSDTHEVPENLDSVLDGMGDDDDLTFDFDS